MKPVYMALSHDVYRLPEAIADTMGELARMRRVKYATVRASVSKNQRGESGGAYIRVYIEEDTP